jgi:hypothetical protein
MIARCWCGKPIIVKYGRKEKGKPSKVHLQCKGNTPWRRENPGLHVHLHYDNVCAFLEDVIDEQLEGMIAQMRESIQQDVLLEQVRVLEEQARAMERAIAEAPTKRRAMAEEEARHLAARHQMPYSERLVLQMLETLVLNEREELREIEERLARERRLLETLAEPRTSDIEQIRLDFVTARSPQEKNAVLRRVLSMRFTQTPADAASLRCFIDLRVAAVPPVEVPLEIVIHPWQGGVKRLVRFPESAEADILTRIGGSRTPS